VKAREYLASKSLNLDYDKALLMGAFYLPCLIWVTRFINSTYGDQPGHAGPAWWGLPKRKVLVCNAPADLGEKSPFHSF
jgi:hypothetical protein